MSGERHLAVVRAGCPAQAREWVDRTFARLGPPLDRATFQAAFAGAARRVGAERFAVDGEDGGRPLDEIARAALLLRALDCLPSAEHAAFVDEVYRRGDSREQAAVLRTLALLPEPARFLATAVEACRTNVRAVFEAIACGNPYPAAHFPDLAFNQMVLKALFVELPLASVVGLRARITPELRRMADDYARERRAAGRPVPDDIAILTEARGSAA
jgi:hypothetical protein